MTDQHTLTLFITLAEQLHFRKTSERHHMTTSALTRAIQRLEEGLGVMLFERSKRSVKLTENGERFYAYARQMVAAYEQLQLDFHATPDHIQGTIKLYATVTAAYSILPSIIKHFRNLYPLVTTYLETGSAKGAYEHLRTGEADFSVGILTKSKVKEILSKKILETPLVFVVPKSFTHATLQTIPLIFPEPGDLSALITTYLESETITTTIHSYVEGHEAILAMVAAGLGGAILPQIVIDHSHLKDDVVLSPLRPKLPHLEVGIFVKKSSLDSPVKKAFWENVGEKRGKGL